MFTENRRYTYIVAAIDTLLGVPGSFTYDNSSENDQDVNMDMIILLLRHDNLV